MVVHRYAFYLNDDFIETYRVNNEDFELIKYRGEERYLGKDVAAFCNWFKRVSKIATDDEIDFCILSDSTINIEVNEFHVTDNSLWTKSRIAQFCKKIIGTENFKVIIDDTRHFYSQIANQNSDKTIRCVYLKCFPELSNDCYQLENETELQQGEENFFDDYMRRLLEEKKEKSGKH